jgi:hypothetical protein
MRTIEGELVKAGPSQTVETIIVKAIPAGYDYDLRPMGFGKPPPLTIVPPEPTPEPEPEPEPPVESVPEPEPPMRLETPPWHSRGYPGGASATRYLEIDVDAADDDPEAA